MTAMTTNNEDTNRADKLWAETLSRIPHEFLNEAEKQLLLNHGYAVQDMLPGLEYVR